MYAIGPSPQPLRSEFVTHLNPDEFRTMIDNHVASYLATDGVEGAIFNGVPCVILSTVGAKSGELRLSPIVRVPVPDSEDYLAVASMGGAPKHPSWFHNIVAHPDQVALQDRAVKRNYQARVVDGDERDALWNVAVDVYPLYAKYQTRTERVIPVIRLTPTE